MEKQTLTKIIKILFIFVFVSSIFSYTLPVLGRADLPWIIHWDYKQKYEVGTLNPVETFLADKPYEHRVTGLPFRAPEGMELLDQIYRIEWMQHHFP